MIAFLPGFGALLQDYVDQIGLVLGIAPGVEQHASVMNTMINAAIAVAYDFLSPPLVSFFGVGERAR